MISANSVQLVREKGRHREHFETHLFVPHERERAACPQLFTSRQHDRDGQIRIRTSSSRPDQAEPGAASPRRCLPVLRSPPHSLGLTSGAPPCAEKALIGRAAQRFFTHVTFGVAFGSVLGAGIPYRRAIAKAVRAQASAKAAGAPPSSFYPSLARAAEGAARGGTEAGAQTGFKVPLIAQGIAGGLFGGYLGCVRALGL